VLVRLGHHRVREHGEDRARREGSAMRAPITSDEAARVPQPNEAAI
jgi:hypothetical protein